jgi:hypothetical protein
MHIITGTESLGNHSFSNDVPVSYALSRSPTVIPVTRTSHVDTNAILAVPGSFVASMPLYAHCAGETVLPSLTVHLSRQQMVATARKAKYT